MFCNLIIYSYLKQGPSRTTTYFITNLGFLNHGVRHGGGGARGAMAPPKERIGVASNAFGPPNFLGKFCYETQLMYNVFL